MWPKKYRDYPPDSPLIKYRVAPGKGIVGCEMHEINGWGNTYHLTSQQWRSLDDAERKSHVGSSDSLPPLPEMQKNC